MCEELNDQLAEGDRLAWQLVEHLRMMGAARAEMPVSMDGKEYHVIVEQVPTLNAQDCEICGDQPATRIIHEWDDVPEECAAWMEPEDGPWYLCDQHADGAGEPLAASD
jgi:hypothetical protein